MKAAIKNFFGCPIKVGSKVTGYTDFSIQITGVVTEVLPDPFEWAKVKGTVRIDSNWNGIIEKETDGDYVSISRLRHTD